MKHAGKMWTVRSWLIPQFELTATRPRVRGNPFEWILGGITLLLLSILWFFRAVHGSAYYRRTGYFAVLGGALSILFGVTEIKLSGSPWRWASRAALVSLILLLLLAMFQPVLR